mmetsp:Transcript_9679/g.20812  ORF Transcript_9679/g.20812 Transcript_9679/m.20812 type:complete len:81 (-) Transcript_9679:45-287(-)
MSSLSHSTTHKISVFSSLEGLPTKMLIQPGSDELADSITADDILYLQSYEYRRNIGAVLCTSTTTQHVVSRLDHRHLSPK